MSPSTSTFQSQRGAGPSRTECVKEGSDACNMYTYVYIYIYIHIYVYIYIYIERERDK